MTTASETPVAPSPSRATRPFIWSVRRELWEYRSAYIAPLITAGFVMFGFLIRLAHLPELVRHLASRSQIEQFGEINKSTGFATVGIIVAGLVVSVFYSLGALNNERRDRSILFWKSLPVSDVTTVLSKASMPLFVVPCIVFVITLSVQLVMQVVGSAVLAAKGISPAILWTYWPPLKMTVMLLYGLVVLTLWWAPIYGWLLFISAWAKRMTFLWAVLPVPAVMLVEKIGLDTSYLAHMFSDRLTGFLGKAFSYESAANSVAKGTLPDQFSLLTPMRFLESPGLWLGLVAAGVFLAGAVWLRRNREPI
jgi:ABC-2 type transport system permease protein